MTTSSMTRLLCGTLLLAGLSNACGEEADFAANEGALAVDTSVQTLESNAPGQTVFNGVAPSPAAAADPEQAVRDLAVKAYSASFAAELADAEAATASSAVSTQSTASTESTASSE